MDSFWTSVQTGRDDDNNPSSVSLATRSLKTWQNILITLACSELQDVSTNERIYPALGSHLGTGATFFVERKEAKGRKLVAVKHVRKTFIQSRNDSTVPEIQLSLDAVLLEIKVLLHLNSLQHRNIVRILAYGWDDGPVPYLVLEYADLGSLDQFLQTSKQPWAEKDRVAIGLASALEMLHACEVIHGDIKLGNILVFANLKRGFDAKLADFGFSCSMALGQRVFRGTRVSNAPEIRYQTALVEDISVYEKADVYSYGLALWEILNDGRHYFSCHPINIVPDEDQFDCANTFLAGLDSQEAEIIPYGISSTRELEMPQEMAKRMISVIEISLLRDVHLRADIRIVREILDASGQSEPEIALPLLMPCYSIFDVTASPLPWGARKQLKENFMAWSQDARNPSQGYDTFQNAALSALGYGDEIDQEVALEELKRSSSLGYLPATVLCHSFSSSNLINNIPHDTRNKDYAVFLTQLHIELQAYPPEQKFARQMRSFYEFQNASGALMPLKITFADGSFLLIDQSQLNDLVSQRTNEEIDEAVVTLSSMDQPVNKPLLHHLIMSHESLAEMLFRRGCDSSRRTHNLLSMLIVACAAGSRSLVQLLLELCPHYASRGTREGISPLHWLFMFREEEMDKVAEDLVGAGADVARVGVGNFPEFNLVFVGSPLQWAIMARSTQAIKVLVKLGVDLNQEVPRPMVECLEYSTIALDLAVLLLLPEIVDLLLCLGTNMKQSRSEGKAPIHYIGDAFDPFRLWLYHGTAVERAATETVEVLLNHGADLNDQSKFTSTPLDCICTSPVDLTFVLSPFLKFSPKLTRGLLRVTAAVSLRHDHAGHKKMALLLDYCSKHWDPEIFAFECKSAIKACAQDGTVAAAREIFKHLLDETGKFMDDDELVHLAAENDHPEMIDLLLNYGANIDLDTGGTPAAAAASRAKRNSLHYLLSKGASIYSQPTLNSQITLLHEIVSETSSRHESEATLHLIYSNKDLSTRFNAVMDNFDDRGFTALHEAVIWASLANVVCLLDMGSKDCYVQDTDISTTSLAQLAMEHNPWLIKQQGVSEVQKYNNDMKQILEFLVVSVGFKQPNQITPHEHVTKFWTRPSPSLWKDNDRVNDWYNPRQYTDTGRDSDSSM